MKKIFLIALAFLFLFSTVPNASVSGAFLKQDSYEFPFVLNEHQKIDPAFLNKIKLQDEMATVIVEVNKPCVIEAQNRNVVLRLLNPVTEEILKREQEALLEELKNSGLNFELGYTFQNLLNGFSIRIKGKDMEKLLKFKEIKNVYENKEIKVELYDALDVTGARKVWDITDSNGVNFTGEEIVVGIIDTGIDYTHPDLGEGLGEQYKVIGGYDFVNKDNDPMDDNSHGTHVAGIVSANGRLKGVAPDSKLMAYKVLDKDGYGKTEWVIAGMERALKDKCDVVNLSLGNFDLWLNQDSPEVKTANNLAKSGVVVVNSAGNAGTRTADLQHPISGAGVGLNVISVAASSVDSLFKKKYVISFKTTYREVKSINAQAAKLPLQTGKVFPENVCYGIVNCGLGKSEDFNNKNLSGKIALIKRGEIYFSEKLYNAAKAGALGVIIYNNEEDIIEPGFSIDYDKIPEDPSQAFIPCAIISQSDGNYIESLINQEPTVSFKYEEEPLDENITSYSSQGPTLTQSYQPMFKPEITAPGEYIYSTVLNKKYDWYSGTSMASPMVAGAVALLKQAHPDWSADDFKDALMNTADILMNPPEGKKPTYGAIPLAQPVSFTYQGAGRIDILNAVNTPALIHPGAFAFQNTHSKEAFDFNIRNTSKEQETFTIEGKMLSLNSLASGVHFEFLENPLIINPNETKKISITLNIDDSFPQGQHEGAIFLKDINGFMLHIPFYFFRPTIPFPKTVTDFSLSSTSFSPNGDGVNDVLKIKFLVGKGTTFIYGGPANKSNDNYLYDVKIEVLDNKGTILGKIFDDSSFPIIPSYYEFVWDGETNLGRNFLNNGAYKLKLIYVESYFYTYDSDTESWKLSETNYANEEVTFTITDTSQIIDQEPAQIYISPPKCIKSGSPFAISIFVKNAIDLGKINFSLKFNPNIFSIKEVLNDGFFSQNWYETKFETKQDNLNGVLNIGIEAEDDQERNGDGTLCTLIFDTQSIGSSNLSFEDVKAFDSIGNESKVEGKGSNLDVVLPDAKPSVVLRGDERVFTNKQDYVVSGTSMLVGYLMINGTKVIPDTSGQFTANIALKEGENRILIEAKGCTGETFILNRVVVLDTISPDLFISSPLNNSTVETDSVIILGKAIDSGTGVDNITINGNFISLSSDGSFSANLNLREGLNTFTITSEDKVGNKISKTLAVIYKKPIEITTIILQIGSSTFIVNGETKALDSPPVIKNGRTLLPIRAVIESLGGTIDWDGTERKVTITLKDTTIELWIGKPQAKVNDVLKWIDETNHKVMHEIINGRIMLPLRFVSEQLGAKVDWDNATKTITIIYPVP
jgi:minor extracellular serine protease Vpr